MLSKRLRGRHLLAQAFKNVVREAMEPSLIVDKIPTFSREAFLVSSLLKPENENETPDNHAL